MVHLSVRMLSIQIATLHNVTNGQKWATVMAGWVENAATYVLVKS